MFETERLLLRDYRDSDAEGVHAYASDPLVTRYLPCEPNTPGETQAYLDELLRLAEEPTRKAYYFAVVLKKSGELIGGCNLDLVREHPDRCLFGYVFNRQYWGQGYASEAVRGLLAYSFSELALTSVFATCDVANLSSIRLLERLGMCRDEHFQEKLWPTGGEHYLYYQFRHVWQARWGPDSPADCARDRVRSSKSRVDIREDHQARASCASRPLHARSLF